MMLRIPVFAVLAVGFPITAVSSALAAERTLWVGRDIDNKKIFWTCSNAVGNEWTLKRNGKAAVYEGVTSTAEFVELQMKGTTKFERVRLYKDKLCLNKLGSKTQWIEMARGKWSD
jgi:hypothetical protein